MKNSVDFTVCTWFTRIANYGFVLGSLVVETSVSNPGFPETRLLAIFCYLKPRTSEGGPWLHAWILKIAA